MVYYKEGESKYDKTYANKFKLTNISNEIVVNRITKGIPQTYIKKKEGEIGRPRIVPKKGSDNIGLKQSLGLTIKGMTAEQRRTYNRLAKRKEYARDKQRLEHGQTASDYKKKLGITINRMSKEEKKKYDKLSKQEQRFRNN
tara:strand:- start:2778 stop:3203 length:426 start_codon:yes stop_codon:yes gene_type:complete